ncbi:MAG: hypothetical protein GY853_13165 [PVC group bacterium]|nr:hypothetical protein [PVC group bacterium]
MSHSGTGSTMVGYCSPPGHDHDDNCLSRTYRCENGHEHRYSLRRRCNVEGCGWVGKDECFCHDGKKVDKWPDE